MVDGLVPLFLPSSAICVTVTAKTGVIMLDAGPVGSGTVENWENIFVYHNNLEKLRRLTKLQHLFFTTPPTNGRCLKL